MYVDILGGREYPEAGWYLQAIGKDGKRNSAYLVLSARIVKRRVKSHPRVAMEIEAVEKIPQGSKVFEFRWYPRKKKRKTFEQYMQRF